MTSSTVSSLFITDEGEVLLTNCLFIFKAGFLLAHNLLMQPVILSHCEVLREREILYFLSNLLNFWMPPSDNVPKPSPELCSLSSGLCAKSL